MITLTIDIPTHTILCIQAIQVRLLILHTFVLNVTSSHLAMPQSTVSYTPMVQPYTPMVQQCATLVQPYTPEVQPMAYAYTPNTLWGSTSNIRPLTGSYSSI